ncbi:hypothetical protein TD95_004979 [Thielaviopsis punctulata]|uniref:Uncharacterized protein n=1 Tax=Thielaviopsis punctulata TaxID=72032 RepID=A0A0F4ZGY0_9PEZI|nr:hypothetical protein TD95_004979 [Thielaviopsis punctulata]
MAPKASSGDSDLLGKGSIVVFEGPSEVVCTQLRLLPASPHILVLPGLQTYLPDRLDRNLNCETYIRHIHNAAAARHDAAVDFIRAGSPDAKRLVFLNGGTARAYAMCIQYISDHECHGNASMAESRLRELLGGGPLLPSSVDDIDLNEDSFGETFEERIINVMRAAEALDEKTSDLQSEPYSAASIYPRPRSMSLPVYGFTDRFGDLAAFYMFGSPLNQLEMDEANEVTRELFSRASSVFASAASNRNSHIRPERPVSPTETVSSDRSSCRDSCVSPTTPYPPRRKQTLDNTLVEAWASDLRVLLPHPLKPPQRTRSLQFKYGKKTQSNNGRPSTPPSKTELLSAARIPTSDRPISCFEMPQDFSARLSSPDSASPNENSPPKFRACFASPFESEDSPRDRRESRRASIRKESIRRESMRPESIRRPSIRRESRQDMVVFFRDETRDNLLERVVNQFQNGTFPCVSQVLDCRRPSVPRVVISRPTSCFIPQAPTLCPHAEGIRRASSPQTRMFKEDYEFGSSLKQTVEEDEEIAETVLPLSNEHLLSSFPPTPVHTPPLSAQPEKISSKFHVLSLSHTNTAVGVQNSLRSILDTQFPRGEVGYQQFCPMLPELNGLWKPVFRETEPNSGHREKRKVDFILALGAQNNVNKGFSESISRKLEQLGTRPCGDSRSGRLDLRYLIVNAMQAFTSQRLLYQTEDNPFTNPYLLASLVIPHLETFLAAHSHIRYLLLDYPPDHLTTILAVQKMIGSDIMKVAQIFDANQTEKAPFNPLPTQPPSPSTATNYVSDQSALSRANLLLSSAAVPSEIESFIHAVSSVLVRISPFYDMTPEEDCPPLSPAVRTPLKGPFSPFPRRGSAQSTHLPPTPISSARGGGFKLSRPPKGRDSKSSSTSRNISPVSKILGSGHDNSSVIEIKVSEISDSDLDDDLGLEADERRLLPMFFRKKPNRLATSDKAMRFLGLT